MFVRISNDITSFGIRRGVIICRNCTFCLKLAHYIVNCCCCFYPLLNKKSLRLAAATLSHLLPTTKSSLLNFPPTLVLSLIETIYQVSQYQTNIESAAANLILSLLLLALLSTMSYSLLNSFFPNLVKINGFWSYKNILKQFEQKKMCKKYFSHWRK